MKRFAIKNICLLGFILGIFLHSCARIKTERGEGAMLEKSNKSDLISIGIMGDVMLGRLVDEHINALKQKEPEKAFAYPWGDTLALLKKNQLNLINLETAITSSQKPVPKVFNFKMTKSNIEVLKTGSINVVNLANNHVLDYGQEGLQQTLSALKGALIPYVGAGENINEARRMHLSELSGVRIGILGATDNEPSWLATATKPGTNYVQVGDEAAVKNWIGAAKSQADLVILSIHWGPNNRERPTKEFQRFAHFLIDNGIDVIHGHSAHIFQGVEGYKQGLIIYDSGDFIDDYYVDPVLRNDRSFLFVLQMHGKVLHSLRMHPVLINNMQVNLLSGEAAMPALLRMIELSKELGTTVIKRDGYLELSL